MLAITSGVGLSRNNG